MSRNRVDLSDDSSSKASIKSSSSNQIYSSEEIEEISSEYCWGNVPDDVEKPKIELFCSDGKAYCKIENKDEIALSEFSENNEIIKRFSSQTEEKEKIIKLIDKKLLALKEHLKIDKTNQLVKEEYRSLKKRQEDLRNEGAVSSNLKKKLIKFLIDEGYLEFPNLQHRRLNSIARLIQGDNTCGAVYFGEDGLYVATNERNQPDISRVTMEYLSALSTAVLEKRDAASIVQVYKERISEEINKIVVVAQASQAYIKEIYNYGGDNSVKVKILEGSEEKSLVFETGDKVYLVSQSQLPDDFTEIYDAILSQNEFSKKNLEKIFNLSFEKGWLIKPKKVFKDALSAGYKARLIKDFEKVTDSILVMEDSKSLPKVWLQAMSSSIEFIEHSSETEINVHAEMKLLPKIKIPPLGEENRIGVSKACCAKCACTFNAINEVIPELKIKVTRSHSGIFSAGVPPIKEMKNVTEQQESIIAQKILSKAMDLRRSCSQSQGSIETITDFYHDFRDPTTFEVKQKHIISPSPVRAPKLIAATPVVPKITRFIEMDNMSVGSLHLSDFSGKSRSVFDDSSVGSLSSSSSPLESLNAVHYARSKSSPTSPSIPASPTSPSIPASPTSQSFADRLLKEKKSPNNEGFPGI